MGGRRNWSLMEKLKVKKITSLEKVFPFSEPTGEGMEDVLTALKGETVSFQMAYHWGGNRKGRAQIQATSPVKEHVMVRSVGLVPCEYPTHIAADDDYLTREPGLYPDLLREVQPWGVELISGQWKSLWVDLDTDGLEAGDYQIRVDMVVEGTVQGSAVVIVQVLPMRLSKMPVPHTEWLHTDCLANYYDVEVFSEKYWQIVENFVRTAVKRKCNMLLTPVFTPPLDTEIGGQRRTVQLVDVTVTTDGYQFGFDRFERWVEMCRRCGIRYYEISHLFSQWGAAMAPKIMGNKDGKQIQLFGWDTDAIGAEYGEFMHQFLIAFKAELEKMDISKVTYFHVSDEPNESQFESYKAAKELMEKDLEGYEMIDALSDYSFYEKGVVSQPVCALDHIQPFLEKRPEKLWGYYCTGQYLDVSNRFIVQPGYRTRILGAQMYKYQLNGFLHWGYNFYNAEHSIFPIDPYRCTDAAGAFPSGDPFLVYPGKDGNPEESIRMMLMDEAMSDLCAMKCLEELAGRDAVMKCIEPEGGEKVEFKSYPRSISYLTGMRKRINQEIAKYCR